MERLTGFWDKEDKYISDATLSDYTDDNGLFPISEEGVDKVIQKLGEYEDLEEQGRLIKLPCKVGDTLYRLVPNLYREYVEIKIAQFVINKNGIYFITDKGVSWSADKIGKTVFLTKSEAEQKLKELRGGA